MKDLDIKNLLSKKEAWRIVPCYTDGKANFHLFLAEIKIGTFENAKSTLDFKERVNDSDLIKVLSKSHIKTQKMKIPISKLSLQDFPDATEVEFWKKASRSEIEEYAASSVAMARLLLVVLNEK